MVRFRSLGGKDRLTRPGVCLKTAVKLAVMLRFGSLGGKYRLVRPGVCFKDSSFIYCDKSWWFRRKGQVS